MPSPAILKTVFHEELLASSNVAYKSARRSMWKGETGASFSHGSNLDQKQTQTWLFY